MHARSVAAALRELAASVRIVRLPDLPPKGDVVDWLAAGGTADELERIAGEVPRLDTPGTDKPEQQNHAPTPGGGQSASGLKIVDPRLLLGKAVPDRQWIVNQWLPVGNVRLNYADGAIGKTLLAQQLMTSCATGFAWCGLAVERCRSLAFFCEDDEDEIFEIAMAALFAAKTIIAVEYGRNDDARQMVVRVRMNDVSDETKGS